MTAPGAEPAESFRVRADLDCPVVLGPGPTDPVRAGLLPIVRRAERSARPLLGICLGHQALGLAFGARLVRGVPVHGKQRAVRFMPSRLFPGIVGEALAMRYHSLVLEDVRAPLIVVAATPEGLPMAIEHAALPMAGLQFHPDSYATPRGREMVAAFFAAVGYSTGGRYGRGRCDGLSKLAGGMR